MLMAKIVYMVPSKIYFYWTERTEIDENYFQLGLWDECKVYPTIELPVSLELLRDEQVKEILNSPDVLKEYYLILRMYLHEEVPRGLLEKKIPGIMYPDIPCIFFDEFAVCYMTESGSYRDFVVDCAQAEIDVDSFK